MLEKAIDIIGGQVATAKAVNTSQPSIWKWLNSTKEGVAGEFVIAVAKATDWQVTPHQLRPDLYPHPEDGLPRDCADEAPAGRRANDRRHRTTVVTTP